MGALTSGGSTRGKFAGFTIPVPGMGKVELTHLLSQSTETAVYALSDSGLLAKTFDLACSKADEVSYGPYLSYCLELENFEDIQGIEELRSHTPVFYGSHIDAERKFAFIVMEYFHGENLLVWCRDGASAGYPQGWANEFRATLYQTLAIVKLFHEHGVILIDFKPDNVIRLYQGGVRFVDLGAFLTPRHSGEIGKYLYSATPDYSELAIDSLNVQTGIALGQGSDIFAAGVAFFEMATGDSRLGMAAEMADKILKQPGVYLFRDSQIKNVWRLFPHLKDLLPLVEQQLKERRILFSEFWHLLRGYLAEELPNWESLSEDQHRDLLLETGTVFITEQLPQPLLWLGPAIARATTLRKFRLGNVAELIDFLAEPITDEVSQDIARHNELIRLAQDLDPPVEFRQPFNAWEIKTNPLTGHAALSSPLIVSQLRQMAPFMFVKEVCRDGEGHRFHQIVGDQEADDANGEKLTLQSLAQNYSAWIG